MGDVSQTDQNFVEVNPCCLPGMSFADGDVLSLVHAQRFSFAIRPSNADSVYALG
jgi:hypothetical protein